MIVVPDDFPSVFEGSEGHQRARRLDEVRVFTERGADQEAELIRRIGDATAALNIRAHARFSEGVFAACPKLKIVSVWGTGTDNIDLNAAGMRGVTVCNTPGINAFAVAEHALTLMLTTARKVVALDAEMRRGKWPREMLTQCLGKTLGVFGMRAIGARLATGAAALEAATDWLVAMHPAEPRQVAAGAVPYLELCGIVLGGLAMARAARIATARIEQKAGDTAFYAAKVTTARFYAEHILPQSEALAQVVMRGAPVVLAADDTVF